MAAIGVLLSHLHVVCNICICILYIYSISIVIVIVIVVVSMMVGLSADVSVQTHRKIKKRKEKEKEKLLIAGSPSRVKELRETLLFISSDPLFFPSFLFSFLFLSLSLSLSILISFLSLLFHTPFLSSDYSYSSGLRYILPPDHGPACPRLTGYAVLKQNLSRSVISIYLENQILSSFDQTEPY